MATYGTQRGRLVPCSRSQHHPFHPENERCDWCEPVVQTFTPTRKYGQQYRAWYYGGGDMEPWEDIGTKSQEEWDTDAEMHIKQALTYTGVLPEWHPDYDTDGPTLPPLPFWP